MTSLHGGTSPLAALTTVFTPPCPTSWLLTTSKLPSQFPSFPAVDASTTSCDPPAWSANLAGLGFQYYSPALCPAGFAVGAGCLFTASSLTAQGFPPAASGETIAFCVPSGESCTSDTTDFHGGFWGAVPTTTAAASALFTVGPPLQIRWRDVDLSVLATHPLTPGLTLAGGTTATTASTASTTASTDTPASTSSSRTTTAQKTSVISTSTLSTSTGGKGVTAAALTTSSAPSSIATTASTTLATSIASTASAAAAASNTTQSHKRIIIGVTVMAAVLGLTTVAGVALFVLVRRRRLLAQALDGESTVSDSPRRRAVGVGAWVGQTQTWPRILSSVRRSRGHSAAAAGAMEHTPVTFRAGSPTLSEPWFDGQDAEDVALPGEIRIRVVAPPPVHPSWSPRSSSIGSLGSRRHSSRSSCSSSTLSDMDRQKRYTESAAAATASSAQQRWSWMSRLSRYMRGGGGGGTATASTRSGLGPADLPESAEADDAVPAMKHSAARRPSTRWSRRTAHTDTESLTDGGDDGRDVSSWEAFSRAQGAVARVVVITRTRLVGGLGGLTAPLPGGGTAGSAGLLRVPSMAGGRSLADSEDDDVRFSRLSAGTFGHLGSSTAPSSEKGSP